MKPLSLAVQAALPLLCVARPLAGAPAGSDHPNILWLVSEDNDCFLGCYGDARAHTPTLDRLAREGIVYTRCFAQPVCAPSRFTLITGMYATSCGPAEHMRALGKIPPWLQGFPAKLREAGYYTTNNDKTDYNSPLSIAAAWDESSRTASWQGRAGPSQPFFSVFNFFVTHESCLFPERDVPLDFPPTDPASVRIPAYEPDTPEMRADWARYYDHMRLLDEQIARRLEQLDRDGLTDDTIVFYYSDNGGVLPRSKRFLQASGIHVPLIVYFPPKWRHLAPAVPGSRIDDPVSFVDFAPTILSLAGVPVPRYMEGRPFLGAERGPPNSYAFISRDRMDEWHDMSRAVVGRRWLYIRNYRPDLPYVAPISYMLRARGYQSWARLAAEGKLTRATAQFWGQKSAEELYDLNADPDNVRNLAGDPASGNVLAEVRGALAEHVIATRDNGFLPEGSPIEGYEAARKPGAWDVSRVLQMATLASNRAPASLPELVRGLQDESEPVRWWAAQGCAMLGRDALPAAGALEGRLRDPSDAVVVASAEALARMGRLDLALPALERELQHAASGWTRLQAAEVIYRCGEEARPLLPVLTAVLSGLAESHDTNSTDPGTYEAQVLTRTVGVLAGNQAPLSYPGSE